VRKWSKPSGINNCKNTLETHYKKDTKMAPGIIHGATTH